MSVTLIDQLDPDKREMLDGIQGNILKAHGRNHTANLFIQCLAGEQPKTKDWLKSLVDGEDALIKSGYAQLRSNVLFKQSNIDTGLFACIHISAAGYDYVLGPGTKDTFGDEAFKNGLKARQKDLNDPEPATWEAGFQRDSHFMLLLAHANPGELDKAIAEADKAIGEFGHILTIERGNALKNAEGAGIEHFGYVDGISQPLFFVDELEDYKKKNGENLVFDPSASTDLVLAADPFGGKDALGSYFVFRKLEQNVKGFKQAEQDLATTLCLKGEDRERAGAMLVGRFEDGTPVQVSDEAGLIHSADFNNFDYDPNDGSKCPFHAHIRKSNPRSGGGMEEAKTHIMARRGIPYGTRTDDPNDGQVFNKPEDKVGLLFMSYQKSIKDQFEFIQTQTNNPANGTDPIIGQGDRKPGTFPAECEQAKTKAVDFGQFVHLKGGEYFFAPSMSFLKNIPTL